MRRHTVETCPDDLATLQERLDALAEDGARIISVVWQPRRVEEVDQSAALDSRGSFVIVAERDEASILRERQPAGDVFEEIVEVGRA
jgi:hypothetical protein